MLYKQSQMQITRMPAISNNKQQMHLYNKNKAKTRQQSFLWHDSNT